MTDMALEKLSLEQERLMLRVRDEWIALALGGDCAISTEEITEGVVWLYGLRKLEKPRIVIVDSPLGAVMAARALGAKEVENTDWFGLAHDCGWTAFCDYFSRIGIAGAAEHDGLRRWIRFLRSGVWDMILYEHVAIISRRPVLVKKDEHGSLHGERGPAVLFKDGYSVYVWHGTRLSGTTTLAARIIEDPDTLTAEEILGERNSEIVRAIGERMGWDKFQHRLKTEIIDQATDEITGLTYELLDFEERRGELPRLLRMQSPRLNDGSQPWYVEPVDPQLRSALAARKWQVPKPPGADGTDLGIVLWPSVDECNDAPDLQFEIER